jgi:DNA mismatch endonuclease (patch repair protein)
MRAVKSKGSKIELILGKAMWAKGLRYRKNDGTVLGKPDFTFKKYKIAVFCDSEFGTGKIGKLKNMNTNQTLNFGIKK